MRHASGYKRRDFSNGVWRVDELASLEAGHEVRERVPADFWKQDESKISLCDLPLFWEHNKTQFDSKWLYNFNQRLIKEHMLLCEKYAPDYYGMNGIEGFDDGRTEERFQERQEAFFEQVRNIQEFKYWEYVPQRRYRPTKSLVTTVFTDAVPEYFQYLRNHDGEVFGQASLYDQVEPPKTRSARSDRDIERACQDLMQSDVKYPECDHSYF